MYYQGEAVRYDDMGMEHHTTITVHEDTHLALKRICKVYDYNSIHQFVLQQVLKKFHVDKGLRQDLDEYAGKLQSLSEKKNELEGSEELLEILPEGLTDTKGSDIVLVNRRDDEGRIHSHIEAGDWLEMFSHIVIEAENPIKMREKLIEYSEENGLGHERNFRKWDEQYPDWPEKFWEAFRGGSHESIDSIERVGELKTDISDQASELRDEIEKRIKEGFVAVLIRKAR